MTDVLRDVRGVQLFERRVGVGDGAPVVVLHGGPGASHDYLRPNFDLLRGASPPPSHPPLPPSEREGARAPDQVARSAPPPPVVYYDQRGGGRSLSPREAPLGYTEHVADLDALRDAWGLDRLILAGYSWGGLLAMLYAIAHPERVTRLALVSPAPATRAERAVFDARFAERNLSPALQGARAELRASGLRERDPDAHAKRLFELSVAAYFHDPARARDLTPFRVVARTQAAVWDSLGDYDLRDALARLRVPALVLHGEDDVIPIASARDTAGRLGATFVSVPACGHVPHVEQPQAFAGALVPFLHEARRP